MGSVCHLASRLDRLAQRHLASCERPKIVGQHPGRSVVHVFARLVHEGFHDVPPTVLSTCSTIVTQRHPHFQEVPRVHPQNIDIEQIEHAV